MSINIRGASPYHWLINAFVLFCASFALFSAGFSLSASGIQVAGVDSVGPSGFGITAAGLCVLGSICLGVGSVLLDRRIRARKGAGARLPQGLA